jgi:hypothetical protein
MKTSSLAALTIVIALTASGCASQTETASQGTTPPKISEKQAEATFRHRFAEYVGRHGEGFIRPGSVEETCEATKAGAWKCTGWGVVPLREDCFYAEAIIGSGGHISKESTGVLPLGEPGVSECKI